MSSSKTPHPCSDSRCSLSALPPDEPIFILRAQDSFAPEAVEMWALTAGMRGASRDKISEARLIAQQMRAWQGIHGSKIPD